MKLDLIFKGFTVTILLLASSGIGHAKRVHSYLDENGALVYFNVLQKHTDIDGIPVTLPEVVPAPLPTQLLSTSHPYESLVVKHSGAYGVDPDLVRAVMATESGFNPVAVSNKGAMGLMQLIPSTARRFGVREIFNPDQNIEGGVKYLRFLLDFFKNDLKLALAAYNAGEKAVLRYGGIPNYRETISYVQRIVGRYGDTYRATIVAPPAAVEEPKVVHRIYRSVDADGNVVYTNRPTTE